MANSMRWRYGDTNPVILMVESTTILEIGDLVYMETDDARPASDQADQGTEAANQQSFHGKFVGVAMQSSSAGSADQVRVATTGVFEFDCSGTAFEVGALIGPSENAGGDGLLNQTVGSASTAGHAVGRCAKRSAAVESRVLVDVVSSVLKGGTQEVV